MRKLLAHAALVLLAIAGLAGCTPDGPPQPRRPPARPPAQPPPRRPQRRSHPDQGRVMPNW